MQLITTALDHGIPIILTLFGIVVLVATLIGAPYCRYVALLAQADTVQGRKDFAKHLADRAGGRKIDNGNAWSSFVPAAEKLYKRHTEKLQTTHR